MEGPARGQPDAGMAAPGGGSGHRTRSRVRSGRPAAGGVRGRCPHPRRDTARRGRRSRALPRRTVRSGSSVTAARVLHGDHFLGVRDGRRRPRAIVAGRGRTAPRRRRAGPGHGRLADAHRGRPGAPADGRLRPDRGPGPAIRPAHPARHRDPAPGPESLADPRRRNTADLAGHRCAAAVRSHHPRYGHRPQRQRFPRWVFSPSVPARRRAAKVLWRCADPRRSGWRCATGDCPLCSDGRAASARSRDG